MRKIVLSSCGWLLLICVIAACNKNNFKFNSEYETSHRRWLEFKSSSGNSYRYIVTSNAVPVIGSRTTITVKNGVVTERSFYFINNYGDTIRAAPYTYWVEVGAEIGLHGSPSDENAAITLDEVYSRAKNDWLKDRPGNLTIFEIKNGGMISRCGYIKEGVLGSGLNGITIASILK